VKHRVSLVASCLLALAFAAPAQAMVMNGNFDDGLNHWQGEIATVDTTGNLVFSPGLVFQVGADGRAAGSTDFMGGLVGVHLFQEIDLSGIPAGTALKLSFDLFSLDAPQFFGGINYGCSPGFALPCTGFVDLLGGTVSPLTGPVNFMIDLPDAAGTLAVVSFNVLLTPGSNADASIVVDNVSLMLAVVSEPWTAVLLLIGLLIAGGRRYGLDSRA
jgi:hypothetical protein